jgi:transposase InsO family protein
MPWKEKSARSERTKFVRAVRTRNENFSQVCRSFGISRKTGYKWLKRAEKEGNEQLNDRRRGPRTGADQKRIVEMILRQKKSHPFWGSKKLQILLSRQLAKEELPSRSTVHRVLAGKGMVKGRKRRRRGPLIIVEPWAQAQGCNDIWGVDFKGWFRTGDKSKCFPLTVSDYYSRFILCFELLQSESLKLVQQRLEKLFARYGRPKAIRVDNGKPFGGGNVLGLSRLSLQWRLAGIEVQFMDPASPYQNGRHERMHLSYDIELCRQPASDLKSQKTLTRNWVKEFNNKRPHEALNMRCPAEVYVKSSLSYRQPKGPFRYGDWPTRNIDKKGDLWWGNQRHFIGEAFAGHQVGLKLVSPGVYELYLADLLLGTLHEAEFFDFRPTVEIRKTPRRPRAKSVTQL